MINVLTYDQVIDKLIASKTSYLEFYEGKLSTVDDKPRWHSIRAKTTEELLVLFEALNQQVQGVFTLLGKTGSSSNAAYADKFTVQLQGLNQYRSETMQGTQVFSPTQQQPYPPQQPSVDIEAILARHKVETEETIKTALKTQKTEVELASLRKENEELKSTGDKIGRTITYIYDNKIEPLMKGKEKLKEKQAIMQGDELPDDITEVEEACLWLIKQFDEEGVITLVEYLQDDENENTLAMVHGLIEKQSESEKNEEDE